MNREIKFRGQSLLGMNPLITGFYLHDEYRDSHHISWKPEDDNWQLTPVEGNTVSQYTGRKDKKSVEIYESDLILYQDCIGEVYYCNDTCMFMAKFKTTHSSWSFDSMDDEIEIIGNIHENPELLT